MSSAKGCPIRITYVIPTLDQSGAERQLMFLATHLRGMGHDVSVVALNRGGYYESALRGAGVTVSILQKRFRFDPLTLVRLRQLLHQTSPDIVQSYLFSANTYVRLPGVAPSSATVIVSERCVDSWKSGWQLSVDRWLSRRMQSMTANSKSVADFYQNTVGVAADKLVVIPNGVPVPASSGNAASGKTLQMEFGFPAEAQVIGFVGRLAAQKRLLDLVWAYQLLHQLNENAYLLLIGDGPERDALAEFAQGLGCRDRIHFAGHRSDAGEWIGQLAAFCLPSSFEGMSNSLMEAMVAGVPVVVSDISSNCELVQHEKNGLVVPVGDSPGIANALNRVLSDRSFAQQLGQAAQQYIVEHHSVEEMVQNHLKLYHRLRPDLKLAMSDQ